MITTYNETITDLKVNKIDRETFDTLSAEQIVPQELWFVTSADTVVVDIDKIGVSRDWTPEISALSAELDDVESQIQELDISAIQQELSSVQDELSAMEELADYFESLSAVADLSAVEELVEGKRDYDDLTYNQDNLVLESQLSAYVPTSQFDLSGLGCTTLNLSGTYEDESTFSFDFVVKEGNA